MKTISNAIDLKSAIQELEIRQATEWVLLKEELSLVKTSLKPSNLIKSGLKEAFSGPNLKSTLLSLSMELTGDLISKGISATVPGRIAKYLGILLDLTDAYRNNKKG